MRRGMLLLLAFGVAGSGILWARGVWDQAQSRGGIPGGSFREGAVSAERQVRGHAGVGHPFNRHVQDETQEARGVVREIPYNAPLARTGSADALIERIGREIPLTHDQQLSLREIFRSSYELKLAGLTRLQVQEHIDEAIRDLLGEELGAQASSICARHRSKIADATVSSLLLAASEDTIFAAEDRQMLASIINEADSRGLETDQRWSFLASELQARFSPEQLQKLTPVLNRPPSKYENPPAAIYLASEEVQARSVLLAKERLGLTPEQVVHYQQSTRLSQEAFRREYAALTGVTAENGAVTPAQATRLAFAAARKVFQASLSPHLSPQQRVLLRKGQSAVDTLM